VITYHNINTFNIILLFLRNRSFKEIGFKYKLNYNIITVLRGLYLHAKINGNNGIRLTNLVKFIGYYDSTHIRKYLDKLIVCKMVRLDNNLNYLLEEGLSAIKTISERSEKLVYEFCNSNGVEL